MKKQPVKVVVNINGKDYPCRPTMGAMLRFKNETGKEVTEMHAESVSELCTYLYCCVTSACAADKVIFDMALIDFADALSTDDLTAWAQQIQSETEAGEEKKR